MRLIPAKDVQCCFRKRTGSFVYLKFSESSVRWLKLKEDLVYGVCYNGNVCWVKPETLVVEMPFSAIAGNAAGEMEWEKNVGVKGGLSERLARLKIEAREKQQELWSVEQELQEKCKHRFRPLTKKELADQWMSVGARCLDCGMDFGWRCKVSPTGYCEYGDDGSEYCIHCEHPSERK
jgi:hypothetical protein